MAGQDHTLALHEDGTVWAWGGNWSGQLGDGTTLSRSSPTKVIGLTNIVGVATGNHHSFAIKSDGTLWAWGSNSLGELGDGTTIDRVLPVQVPGLENVIAVTGGSSHSLALTGDGKVWAWGNNYDGVLGNGTYVASHVPVAVTGLADVTAIDAGAYHNLALRRDGTVWSWGWNGYFNQLLGTGTWAADSPTPTQVPTSSVKALTAADYHSVVVRTDTNVWSWGSNESGQLGDGTYIDRATPVRVLNITGAAVVAGGNYHSVALKADGTVWGWGSNYDGALGNGATGDYNPTPVQASISGVQALGAAGNHSVALKGDGAYAAWGSNYAGQVGGTSSTKPSPTGFSMPKMSKPSVPTEVAATAGEELAYVTWKAPAGKVVTQYVVTPFINGVAQAEVVTTSAEAAYAVRNLVKGTTYSFAVAAQNCLGAGPSSSQTNRVVPTGVQLSEQGFKIEGQALTDRMNVRVNTFNGNVNLATDDLKLPGTGLDVVVGRSYNSRAQRGSVFGRKWATTIGTDIRVDVLANGSLFYNAPYGGQVGFAKNADGSFTTPAGMAATMTEDITGNRYTLTEHATGRSQVFDRTTGKLLSEADRNRNTLTYTYGGPNGLLSTVTDTQGRATTFAYTAAGLVSSITDPAGRVHRYGYDAAGNLATHTDAAGGTSMFAYDTAGNVTRVTTPAGRVVQLGYDASNRVTSLQWALAPGVPTTSFTYETGRTVVRDPNGNPTTYHYDPVGRTTKVVDAKGNTTTLGYTSQSNIRRYTPGNGGTTALDYSSGQDLTSTALPTGAKARYEYGDPANPHAPTVVVDPQGNRLTLAYDAQGNLRSETTQLATQNKVQAGYNPNGTVASAQDANGNTTTYGYDERGNWTSTTPPPPLAGNRAEYDVLNRVTAVVDGDGNRTTVEYDGLDRPTKLAYADGSTVTRRYDGDGHLIELVDPNGTTVMAYDPMGRLATRTTPDGETTSYTYDKASNLTAVTTSGGTVTYAYDTVNLPVRVTEPTGAATTFTYDAAYNRTTTAYPNGVTTTRAYDTSNRPAAITALKDAAVLWSATYSYANPSTGNTDAGLRFSVTDKDGKTTSYSYDALNRLVKARTADPGGQLVIEYAYTYDGNGNRLSRTVTRPSAAGPVATSDRYTYNAANQLTSVNGETLTYDGSGNLTGSNAGARFTYDPAGRTTSAQPRPDVGTTSTFAYLGDGQSERIAGGAGGQQLSTGDDVCAPLLPCLNDPNKSISPATYSSTVLGLARETVAGQSKHFVRDPGGGLIAQRNPTGTVYLVTDVLDSVVLATDGSGNAVASFAYEPFGTVTQATGDVTATPFRFAGAYLDPTGLYKMGERYYDPSLGRWTQQDPTTSIFDPRQWNRYFYAGDDPVNFTDPDGLSVWSRLKCMGRQFLPDKDFNIGVSTTVGLGATIALATKAVGGSATLTAMKAGAAGIAAGGMLFGVGVGIVALGLVLAYKQCN